MVVKAIDDISTPVPQKQITRFVGHEDPFLTTEEASHYLSLSVKTLEAWRLQRYGPAYFKFGRSVRYRLSALESFAAKRMITSHIGRDSNVT